MEASDGITLRTLRASDGQRLSRIDERITGRNRSLWYERKLERALRDSDMNVSLGAEVEGVLVGAVLGSVQYGEFGIPEPVAVLDTILVDSLHARQGIATAMLEELASNLSRLGIDRIRTEIQWNDPLSRFLGSHGFALAPVLVLERSLSRENTPDAKET
ncbi:MAG TPA: GNAT family N-acetyltransferase [Thermoanaerobaculia bacterium]|jgi:GNAT superfamily N-acetyltransferase|nr:GNAT family N-acetyltransferase [Thermoanaerobaculia bacterium]